MKTVYVVINVTMGVRIPKHVIMIVKQLSMTDHAKYVVMGIVVLLYDDVVMILMRMVYAVTKE